MKKRALSILLCLSLCLALLPLSVFAAEPTIAQTEATIYAMDDWAEAYLTIDKPQEFQIAVENATSVRYYVRSGKSVSVSSTGLVTPRCTVYYWYGNIGYSSPVMGDNYDKVTKNYTYGTSIVRVVADGVNMDVTVTVKNYATEYADGVLADYIAENITEDMALLDKLNAICKFPALYDYCYKYQSYTQMIVTGEGGDCWASTNTILRLCEMLGLEAYARNGNRDTGSGSGHMNALVIIGEGEYYELEAGYSGTAPRPYNVKQRTSLFCYKNVTGGIKVYQYDGKGTDDTVLTVPDSIDGKTVISIGDSFLSSNTWVTEVVLPDTVTAIGKSAFNSCTALKTLHIPAAVTSIGTFAFTNCQNLTEWSCAEDSLSYVVQDGVLYDKAKTQLLAAPNCASVEIPDTVQTIGDYAFYYNKNIEQIVLPEGVTTLREGAISECDSLVSVTLPQSLTTVNIYAMVNCPGVQELHVPASVTSIGSYGFGYQSSGWSVLPNFRIFGVSGTAAQTYAEENNIPFIDEQGESWVTIAKGTMYYVKGEYVTGWYKIDGECYPFSEEGYLQDIERTQLRNAQEASCTQDGYSGDTYCLGCGELLEAGTVIPATGHTYVDGTCACGAVEVTEPILVENIQIGKSLNLASDISINYMTYVSELSEYDSYYLECIVPVYEGNEKVSEKTFTLEPVTNGEYYYFTLDGLIALQMNDTVCATLYLTKDGVEYKTPVVEYSIATYAYNQLNKAGVSDQMKNLCANLLQYGAITQAWKGYRTDALADAAMTDAHKAYLTDMNSVSFNDNKLTQNDFENASITWMANSLSLESRVVIRFIFKPNGYTGDCKNLSLHVSYTNCDGELVELVIDGASDYTGYDGFYVFDFETMPASEMRSVVSAVVYDGETRISATRQYSVDTYGVGKEDIELRLAQALIAYGDAASDYFAN